MTDTNFQDIEQQERFVRDNPYAFDDCQDAIDAYIRKLNEYENQKRHRQQRLADCGKWGYYFDPHTGKKSGYIMHCDLFRECPKCRQRRADRENDWMLRAVHGKKEGITFILAESQDEANKILRGISKKKYVRYPQADGTEYVFVDSGVGVDGNPVSPAFLREIDWNTIVDTPVGRNKSGTMHIPKSPSPTEKFAIVEIKQFIPDAPPVAVDRAMMMAIIQTIDVDPEDYKEAKNAVNKRIDIAVQILRDQGYSVRVYEKKLKVIISKINWTKYSVNNLNLNTENLTLALEDSG